MPETLLLGGLIAGYILGNRGFAQVMPIPGAPLLLGELSLAITVPIVVIRHAFMRTTPLRRDSLNIAVLLWLVVGSVRLPWDVKTFGLPALRDYATIYYAAFFFVAQSVAANPRSATFLRHVLTVVFAVLPFVYFLYTRFPEFFLQRLQIGGSPLFFYKDDLVAAYLVAAIFFLLTEINAWRYALALACYGSALNINSSRAAIVGLFVTSFWWASARRWAPVKLQAVVIPIALVGLTLLALIDRQPFTDSRVYRLYEHLVSMVDITGARSYQHDDRRYVGDNNRFRLVWWRAVTEETLSTSPLLGLGFGADLKERFLRTYQLDLGDEFTTRSPHSIVFTMLGRLGLLGLTAFLVLVASMAKRTYRLAQKAMVDERAMPALGWWSVSWVMLVSGCFGVVLEGPMGAVIFWSALGLANAATVEMLVDAPLPSTLEQSAQPTGAPSAVAG